VAVTFQTARPTLGAPDSIGYALKRLFLGKPLITEQLKSERLSNTVALGVLSPDAISSSASVSTVPTPSTTPGIECSFW
jgi:hypothetical protein